MIESHYIWGKAFLNFAQYFLLLQSPDMSPLSNPFKVILFACCLLHVLTSLVSLKWPYVPNRCHELWVYIDIIMSTNTIMDMLMSSQLSVVPHCWNSYYLPNRILGTRASINLREKEREREREREFWCLLLVILNVLDVL